MNEKVIVMGAGGLLGSILSPHLQANGYEVIRHSRRPGLDVGFDPLDTVAIKGSIEAMRPRAVVNLIALTDVDKCEGDPQLAHMTNVSVVERLSLAINQSTFKPHLIHISTDQVYSRRGPHREEDVRPVNVYGKTKLASELAAAQANATILRVNFFGKSHAPGRQSLTDWIFKNLKSRTAFDVFHDVEFSGLDMLTLSDAITEAVKQRHPGVYNLGARTGMSKADFAINFANRLGFDTDLMTRVSMNSRHFVAIRPNDMTMNVSKFEKRFQFRLPTLHQAIERVAAEYLDASYA